MASPDELDFAVRLQPLGRECADGVEKPEARLTAGRLLGLDEALVHERHEAIEDVASDLGCGPADRLGGIEIAPAGEYGQTVEQPPPAVLEQLIAPGDRAAQGLL